MDFLKRLFFFHLRSSHASDKLRRPPFFKTSKTNVPFFANFSVFERFPVDNFEKKNTKKSLKNLKKRIFHEKTRKIFEVFFLFFQKLNKTEKFAKIF
jgi:hypothetical protein